MAADEIKTSYYRKVRIDGKVVVTRLFKVNRYVAKGKIPRGTRTYWDSDTGELYYNVKVPVAKIRYLGAYYDRKCTKRVRIG